DMLSPVLVQLQDQTTAEIVKETESDEQGRFSLNQVESGTYQMFFMPIEGEYIQINDLEIS
ncbi:MAG: hypothetical protein AAF639_26070, partial [Chloroflexota bacterium]